MTSCIVYGDTCKGSYGYVLLLLTLSNVNEFQMCILSLAFPLSWIYYNNFLDALVLSSPSGVRSNLLYSDIDSNEYVVGTVINAYHKCALS